jgi:environmental stress-induced protein Ves
MAKVPVSGPFSSFPGVDRTLAVLGGEMVLHVEGRADVAMSPLSAPHRFPGDVATGATVLQAVTDLNVMTRREACSADLGRIEGARRFDARCETLLLLRGHATLTTGEPFDTDDVLWLKAGETAAFSIPAALLWAVELHPAG